PEAFKSGPNVHALDQLPGVDIAQEGAAQMCQTPPNIAPIGNLYQVHQDKEGPHMPEFDIEEDDPDLLVGHVGTDKDQHGRHPGRGPDKGGIAVQKGGEDIVAQQKDQPPKDHPQKIYIDKALRPKEVQKDAAGEIEHEHVPKYMPQAGMEKRIGHKGPGLGEKG